MSNSENNVNNSSASTFTKLIDPKSNKVYNVEKVKNQKIPDHFFASKDVKTILVNGQKIKFMRNVDRTQYVAFQVGDVKYYIRDHKCMDAAKLDTYIKPKAEKKAPSVKKADLLAILTPEQKAALNIQ